MPKSIRRIGVTRTVTYTAYIDVPGYPESIDADVLAAAGGASGNTGMTSIAQLLAGSPAANGSISSGNWSVSVSGVNVESYISRPASAALTAGQRVVSVNPPVGLDAAAAKVFFVAVAGTTGNTSVTGVNGSSTTEPSWNLTDGGTTTDNGVTFRTLPKFPTIVNFATSTAYTVGQIIRPASGSLREYLVTTAGTSGASAPTWTSADTYASTLNAGSAVLMALVYVKTFGFMTTYSLGDVVKPSAASAEEYIVTTAGTSTASGTLSATVGSSYTSGTAVFKRIL